MRAKSLSSKLSLYIIVACAVILLASIWLVAAISSSGLKRAAVSDVTKTLNSSINLIEGRMARVEGAVKGAKSIIGNSLDNPDRFFEITKSFLEANETIYGSAIAFEPWYFKQKGEYFAPYSYRTKDGIRSIQMGNEDYDYFTMEWYQLPKLLKTDGWSEPYFDEGGGEAAMSTYSLPILGREGDVIAILTADITLDAILEVVKRVKTFENSHTFLCSNAGTFISHTDSLRCFNETLFSYALESGSEDLQNIARRIMKGEDGSSEFRTADGKRCFIVYSHFKNGWTLGSICYVSDVYAALKGLNSIMVMVMIAGLLLLFFGIRAIISRQTKPLKEFSEAAIGIAGGNFKTPLPPVTTQDEIGQLHDSMDFMLKSINEYMDKLKTATAAKQKIESELKIASSIQQAMVPHSFDGFDGLDIYAFLRPAKEVGGDLYDFAVDGDNLYFVLGDVSGKGVPAALFMAICCASFRLTSGINLSVDQVISLINNTFAMRNVQNMFVTMFLGRVNLKTGEMEFCNAGHNPIIIIGPDGSARYLQAKANLAAGLFENFQYEKEKLTLEPGSRVLIYTDGVSEAENAAKELFGEERLLAYASSQDSGTGSKEFVDNLVTAVKDFTKENPQNDDITIMSFKFN